MSYYGIQRNKPDDEICHFKYIDRYKKNGKWQYVYEDAKNKVNSTKAKVHAKQRLKNKDVQEATERARTIRDREYDKMNKTIDVYNQSYKKMKKSTPGTVESHRAKEDFKKKDDDRVDAINKYYDARMNLAGREYQEKQSKKYNTKASEKGKAAVDKILSKVNKAKDKTAVKSEKITNNKTPIKAGNKSAKTAVKSEKIASNKPPIKVDNTMYKIRESSERVKKKTYDASGGKEKDAYMNAEKKALEAQQKVYEADNNWALKLGTKDSDKAKAEYDKAKAEQEKAFAEYQAAREAYENTRLYRMEQNQKKRRN